MEDLLYYSLTIAICIAVIALLSILRSFTATGPPPALPPGPSLLSLITVFELVAAGVQMNSDRIVPTESFLTIAAGYLLIYAVMLMLSRGVSLWLAGPAWNAR